MAAVVEDGEGSEASKTEPQQTKLSHKKWRRLLQKEKRRVKRQELAEKRKQLEEQEKWRLENDSLYRARIEAREKAEEKKRLQEAEESKRQEKLWLEREAQAQIAFTKMKEKEEKRERERIEQERRIKEEWEEEQRLKKEKEEKKKQEIQEKENAVFKELEKPAEQTSEDQWHNPLAPATQQNYGTEQDTVNCSFYLKTGACRFGERCSRIHPRLPTSVTLLIAHMYQDIRLSQTMLDEADHDTGLEYDDEEAYERYKHFFDDVLPEFEKAGKVVQFKVCCNHEAHLRGNVYVQFSSEEECTQAFAAFNGRWYAGKQLSCEYSPVTKWRSAICGFFTRNRCPRGKNCNFLHVYRNPGNAFRNMDRDDLSPGRTPYSERGSERSMRDWRQDSRERDRSIRERSVEHRRDRDYERNREYRYSRDRERERNRDREHSRVRDHDGHKRHDRKTAKERDNARDFYDSDHESHNRKHHENRKEHDRGSPKRSKQDRFGRDIDRSFKRKHETKEKDSYNGNSCDIKEDDVGFHHDHDRPKISRDSKDLLREGSSCSSHSDQENNIRKPSSDIEDDAPSVKRRKQKKKHGHKHHKKSKNKHKNKRKRSSSDSDE